MMSKLKFCDLDLHMVYILSIVLCLITYRSSTTIFQECQGTPKISNQLHEYKWNMQQFRTLRMEWSVKELWRGISRCMGRNVAGEDSSISSRRNDTKGAVRELSSGNQRDENSWEGPRVQQVMKGDDRKGSWKWPWMGLNIVNFIKILCKCLGHYFHHDHPQEPITW